jgi:hypothetical protein
MRNTHYVRATIKPGKIYKGIKSNIFRRITAVDAHHVSWEVVEVVGKMIRKATRVPDTVYARARELTGNTLILSFLQWAEKDVTPAEITATSVWDIATVEPRHFPCALR